MNPNDETKKRKQRSAKDSLVSSSSSKKGRKTTKTIETTDDKCQVPVAAANNNDNNNSHSLDAGILQEFQLMDNPNTLIRIPDHHQLLLPLKGINPNIKFRIQSDPASPRPGLEISTMNRSLVCVQLAYIFCRAYNNPNASVKPPIRFIRVSEDQLKAALKYVEHSHFLLIGVFQDIIILHFYDIEHGSDGTRITLPQLNMNTDMDDYTMVPMTFSHVMPIDSKQFHKVIAFISKWKSDFTEFVLYRKNVKSNVANMYTVIQSMDSTPENPTIKKWFRSTVRRYENDATAELNSDNAEKNDLFSVEEVIEIIQEDLEPHTSPIPEFSSMTEVYRGAFPTSYLDDFSTDMGHQDLKIYLTNKDSGGPLMLETKKGMGSYLRLLIACKRNPNE